MRLYRVTNERYADNFTGKGASFDFGARWNSAGSPVIYFGVNMAVSLIEAAHYHPSPRLMPKTHCKAIYEVKESCSIESVDIESLPADWQDMPYPQSTQQLGDAFLQSKRSLILLVPSVGVGLFDELSIAVINPLHPDINNISLLEIIKPVYSERMFSNT